MYIDPNTGGMLFQVLATSLALFSGFILLFSGKIRAFAARFRRSVRGDTGADTSGDENESTTDSPVSNDEKDTIE